MDVPRLEDIFLITSATDDWTSSFQLPPFAILNLTSVAEYIPLLISGTSSTFIPDSLRSLIVRGLLENAYSYCGTSELSCVTHREFDVEPLSVKKIDNIIKEKKAIYDLRVDQRVSKFNKGQKLKTIDLKFLPNYIQNNIEKYKLWLD